MPLTILDNVPRAICWGSLAAILLHSPRGFRFRWPIVGWRWMPLVTLLASIASLEWLPAPGVLIEFLLSLLVVSGVIREDHWLAPFLRLGWIARIGQVNYGMYLFHGLFYAAMTTLAVRGVLPWDARGLVGFLVTTVLTTAVATVSFRYDEGAFLRMKARFQAD